MKKEKKALATGLGEAITTKLRESAEPTKKALKAIEKAVEELAGKLLKIKKKDEEKAEKERKKQEAKAKKGDKKADKNKKGDKKADKKQKNSAEVISETPVAVETPTLVSPSGEAVTADASKPTGRSRAVKTATPAPQSTSDTSAETSAA